MKFNKEEQETVITFEAEEGEWTIYTAVPSHIQLFLKNDRINNADIEVLTEWEGNPTSIRFSIDDSAISIGQIIKKTRTKREPTELQLEAREKFIEMARAKSKVIKC